MVNRCFAVPVHWIPACAGMTGEMCAYASLERGMGGVHMNWLTLVAGLAAAGLFIYLIAALLNPEDFS